MPILTASGLMSVKIDSICASMKLEGTSKISLTPVVFCAVNAVMALMAYTPFMVMVFMSAWMPAPPLQSLPAMVNAVLTFPTVLDFITSLSCSFSFFECSVMSS